MTDHLPMREHVPVGHGIVGALLRLPLALLPHVLWVLSYPEVTAKYTRRSGSGFGGLVISRQRYSVRRLIGILNFSNGLNILYKSELWNRIRWIPYVINWPSGSGFGSGSEHTFFSGHK